MHYIFLCGPFRGIKSYALICVTKQGAEVSSSCSMSFTLSLIHIYFSAFFSGNGKQEGADEAVSTAVATKTTNVLKPKNSDITTHSDTVGESTETVSMVTNHLPWCDRSFEFQCACRKTEDNENRKSNDVNVEESELLDKNGLSENNPEKLINNTDKISTTDQCNVKTSVDDKSSCGDIPVMNSDVTRKETSVNI